MQNFWRNVLYVRLNLIETILILFFFAFCIFPAASVFASTVNLAWNASAGPNVAGYNVYCGTSSGNYSTKKNVGNQTSYSLSGLQEGKKYYFAATAYNSNNAESSYSSEISYTIPASSTSSPGTTGSTSGSGTSSSSSTIIIDNGGSGTSSSGTWKVSSAPGFFGSNSLYSNQSSATYSFAAASSGYQTVYIWYAAYSNRCSNVPVKIYNGSTNVGTATINQQNNGGKWNELGTFNFSGNAKIITTSKGGCITSADAIKLVPSSSTQSTVSSGSTSSSGTSGSTSSSGTSGSTSSSGTTGSTSSSGSTGSTSSSGTIGSSSTIVIDNGGSGTSSSGTWKVSKAPGFFGSNSIYSDQRSATYSFAAASSGSQTVYLWYTAYSNRCSNVPVKIYNGSTNVDTLTINQQKNGGKWNELGTFNFSGNAKIITTSQGGCITSADAVKLVPNSSTQSTVSSIDNGSNGSVIVDNNDSGTSASGTWIVSKAPGFYGSNSVYSTTRSDTYSFKANCSGIQTVYLWWTEFSNRCKNAPVRIYDGSTYLDTVTVNQQNNGGQWNELGTFSFSGKANVIIDSNGGCVTSADAVYFFESD